VALFGSTPSYATGVIDPIAEIAAIAREAGVGMHVDACLGGFIVDNLDHVDGNFLAIPGVTSLSADTHKNGASQCVRALPLPCLC
jgi:glutamate/tyrosine decarboxylase-like PLP-dependent enzyme